MRQCRPGVQASEPSNCDSPEVARRGTEAMRERPSHYPHSPSTQENCLGITSYAEALQRVASIGKPIQQPGTADSKPMPDTRAPPDSPLRGRRGGRGAGVSGAAHGMAGSQPAGAWHQPKTATYPPEFRDSRAGDRVSLLREQDQVKRGSQMNQRRPMRSSTNTIHTTA